MSRVRYRVSISLDGYVCGPNQSKQHPQGEGGMKLHAWVFPTRAFRQLLKLGEGGEEGVSSDVVQRAVDGVGATIMGRNMFGGQPGPWNPDDPWNGWWGDEPPFHHPVFVLTHHARPPLALVGTTFTFVTDGLDRALARAREAAAGKDIVLGGGAHVARLALKAGIIDDMLLHQVPILLGAGERLFEGVTDLRGLALREVLPAPGVTHLRFAR